MGDRVALITGANSGIGLAAAVGLAQRGATVLMTARDLHRGTRALHHVRQTVGPACDRVHLLPLDLASFGSIRACARSVLQQFDRLDVLACNAGGALSTRRTTEQGFEATFGVNHLGHFLLTSLLRDRLVESRGRVVVTASVAHRLAREIRFDDLQREGRYRGLAVYSESKLANVLFTLELARRLSGTGATANCFHPGSVRSGFAGPEDTVGPVRWGLPLVRPLMVSPRRGAQPLIELASAERFADVTGRYFVGGHARRCAEHRPSRVARDPAVARRLWDVSEALIEGSEG